MGSIIPNIAAREVGPALKSATASERQDQFCTDLSHLRGTRYLFRLQTFTWTLVVILAMNTDSCHSLHSHRPKQGPQWQHWLWLHHSFSWQGWLLTTGYSSPPLSLVPSFFIMLILPHFFSLPRDQWATLELPLHEPHMWHGGRRASGCLPAQHGVATDRALDVFLFLHCLVWLWQQVGFWVSSACLQHKVGLWVGLCVLPCGGTRWCSELLWAHQCWMVAGGSLGIFPYP